MENKAPQEQSVEIVVDDQKDTQIFYASFSGPLPPPNMLAGYEKVMPGTADRILRMAEEQARHRREKEKEELLSQIRFESRGMWIAFWLTLILMAIGTIMAMNNKPVEGFIALFGPSLFHASNYLYQKYRLQQEEKENQDQDEDGQLNEASNESTEVKREA